MGDSMCRCRRLSAVEPCDECSYEDICPVCGEYVSGCVCPSEDDVEDGDG